MNEQWLPRTESEVIEAFAVACEQYESASGAKLVVRRWGERQDILRWGQKFSRVDARFHRTSTDIEPRFPQGKLPRFTVKLYGDRWMNLDFHRASGKGWRFEWGREGRLAGGAPPATMFAAVERTLDALPLDRAIDDKDRLDGIWMPLLLRGPREA